MRHPQHHIFDFTPQSLAAWCEQRRMKPFRARQILEWVYRHRVIDPGGMTNLSSRDREVLAREMTFLSGRTITEQAASDGTRKLLIEWDDPSHLGGDRTDETASSGASAASQPVTPDLRPLTPDDDHRLRLSVLPNPAAGAAGFESFNPGDTSRQTECVMIPSLDPSGTRRTACISSQVGCPVGCRFCASGLGGLEGNLSAGRIVEQVWRLGAVASARITNVVFMGMGEPLANLPNVIPAVRAIAADEGGWGLGISARKITISTVGLPKAIEKLADQLDLPITLALSLHAPNDELRRELIPWAQYSTIDQLLAACHKWFQKTGREITLEYTLLGGINDQPEHAHQLAHVARTLRANINLIRYNEVAGLPFKRPRTDDVRAFQDLLRARGINVHIRRSRGRDIAAACGQLKAQSRAASRAAARS